MTPTDNEDSFWLAAFSAAGTPIVGAGPTPTLRIADPSIATAIVRTDGNRQEIALTARQPDKTTIEITWGSVHRVFDVVVPAL